jgi:hypothetical protein
MRLARQEKNHRRETSIRIRGLDRGGCLEMTREAIILIPISFIDPICSSCLRREISLESQKS